MADDSIIVGVEVNEESMDDKTRRLTKDLKDYLIAFFGNNATFQRDFESSTQNNFKTLLNSGRTEKEALIRALEAYGNTFKDILRDKIKKDLRSRR